MDDGSGGAAGVPGDWGPCIGGAWGVWCVVVENGVGVVVCSVRVAVESVYAERVCIMK